MRICMIMSAPLPPREGIGFYTWNLARYLTEQGHQIQIITRGHTGRTTREITNGITIWRPTFVPVYPYHVHLHGLFVNRLIRHVALNVDLFHLHTPLVQPPQTQRPILITVHTPMLADTQSIQATTPLGLLVKLQAPVSVRLERSMFKRAARVVAVAHSVAQELAPYGIDPQQVAVLGNGVDTAQFYPNSQSHDTVRPYVLTAGRLGARKGLEDLVQCAEIVTRTLPDFRFLIAGTGPLEATLRADIAKRGLERNVELLGHVSDRSQLAALYRGATAYVHAAHYEGLPTVLIEAMACARPAIATAVSGNLDVINHELNGLLVPPHAPQEMASAILRLVRNEKFAERLGEAAYQTIQNWYSWDVVGRNYVSEYEALLQGVHCCSATTNLFA